MALRLEYRTVAPGPVRALANLSRYVSSSSIAAGLRSLIEVRVSQINGCGYCIQVHRQQALTAGERTERSGLKARFGVKLDRPDDGALVVTFACDRSLCALRGSP